MNQDEVDILADEEEIIFQNVDQDQNEIEFDNIIYELQELLISEEFEELQNQFIREKCKDFTQANEPQFYECFKEYQQAIEIYVENKLRKTIPNFIFKEFMKIMNNKPDEIDEQILETFQSLSDFNLFKEIMLEQKIRVEEEERTIKKKTNKANNKSKQTQNTNIFTTNQTLSFLETQKLTKPKVDQKQKKQDEEDIQEGDLRADLFLQVRALPTPKITKKKT